MGLECRSRGERGDESPDTKPTQPGKVSTILSLTKRHGLMCLKLDWDGMDGSPGGLGYRAPFGAI